MIWFVVASLVGCCAGLNLAPGSEEAVAGSLRTQTNTDFATEICSDPKMHEFNDSAFAVGFFRSLERTKGPPRPWLFNVGLVDSGTRSFHSALLDLGLASVHVGPCNVPYTLEDPESPLMKFLAENEVFSDVPFNGLGFIKVLTKFAATYPDRVKVVSNVRDKFQWVQSMIRNRGYGLGGNFFRRSFSLPDLPYTPTEDDYNKVYDAHHKMLEESSIPTLEMGRWEPICEALQIFNHSVQDACWAKSREYNGTLPRLHGAAAMKDEHSGPCCCDGDGSQFYKTYNRDDILFGAQRAFDLHAPCAVI